MATNYSSFSTDEIIVDAGQRPPRHAQGTPVVASTSGGVMKWRYKNFNSSDHNVAGTVYLAPAQDAWRTRWHRSSWPSEATTKDFPRETRAAVVPSSMTGRSSAVQGALAVIGLLAIVIGAVVGFSPVTIAGSLMLAVALLSGGRPVADRR